MILWPSDRESVNRERDPLFWVLGILDAWMLG